MNYDYIIAGAGIAGSVCAYELCKKQKKCLLIEKEKENHEKICGGGISYKAIKLLSDIGINLMDINSDEVQKIYGHTVYFQNSVTEKKYANDKISLGMQRRTLDSFLQKKAVEQGADIIYGQSVDKVINEDNMFCVNNYYSNNFICAVGARGLNGKPTKGQSVGISMQIEGESLLNDHIFHYWYLTETGDKYLWAFPIGINRWNIGIWFQVPDNTMKSKFECGIEKLIIPSFKNNYKILLKPKGEFLGNIDLRNNCITKGIGDFAGCNNIKNGGGIIGAVQSAIEMVSIECINLRKDAKLL